MQLEVENFELPPIGTQCYAVMNPETQSIAVFDAPLNAYITVERLAVKCGYRMEGLYFTHGHWDHTLDGKAFNEAGIASWAHAGDRHLYETPGVMAAFSMPGLEMHPVKIDHWLEDGAEISICGSRVEVRHVPGHSEGSILYWFSEAGFAISGDALFRGSVGRTDFPGCSHEALMGSIRERIYSLPGETRILPGHGDFTTVAEEARSNPFVQA
jgi:glyoxylase-like metal-dependent hydrolase (beta-lactamase superfamily II)